MHPRARQPPGAPNRAFPNLHGAGVKHGRQWLGKIRLDIVPAVRHLRLLEDICSARRVRAERVQTEKTSRSGCLHALRCHCRHEIWTSCFCHPTCFRRVPRFSHLTWPDMLVSSLSHRRCLLNTTPWRDTNFYYQAALFKEIPPGRIYWYGFVPPFIYWYGFVPPFMDRVERRVIVLIYGYLNPHRVN